MQNELVGGEPDALAGLPRTPQRIEVERDGVSVLAHAQIEQVRDVDVDGEEAPRADKHGAHPFHIFHEGAVGLTMTLVSGRPRLKHAVGARHAEAEHGDGARLGVAERFEVNPVEGRGRKADPVAQEHR